MSSITLITGDDEFLVEAEARVRFEKMTAGVEDDMSKEMIDAACVKVADVENTLALISSAVSTLSLFGDKKFVRIRNLNWIADSPLGKSDGAKAAVTTLIETLGRLDPDAVEVLISAHPLDGRRREAKALKELGEVVEIKSDKDPETLAATMCDEAGRLGVTLDTDAARALVAKVNGNMRMMRNELEKLACHAGEGGRIDEAAVIALVPVFGEGDFFEPAEAFFSGDLPWTLDALRRYFYQNDEARPLIASIQGRCRLLIQLRAMMDAGAIRVGPRGIAQGEFENARRAYAGHYPEEAAKVKYNVFAANLWYLGNKIAPAANKFTLRRLVDTQLALTDAFAGILDRPGDQESVMREFAVKRLG